VPSPILDLLRTFSWQELRQHPWRNTAVTLAVMLGVALAFSVHLINASALDEFAHAARSVAGQGDLEIRAVQGALDEKLLARVALPPEVLVASPVLEIGSYLLTPQGKRSLRVLGVDALSVAAVSPDLLPRPDPPDAAAREQRWTVFSPGQVFLNAAARALASSSTSVQLQGGLQWLPVQVAGQVMASGSALAVMDIGAAQDLFGKQGQLSRIDLRLRPGVDREVFASQLRAAPDWPDQVRVAVPQDKSSHIGNLSRAYRVNLAVLALIALFTGAFLVFSVLSLSVAKRAQQFALLGVLGLGARARMALVLWESLILGLVGSVAGLALGTVLAALALQLLGGDLGGGFFSGAVPALQFNGWAALLYGGLGVLAALAGGWWPARFAQRLTPAQTLKGLGHLGTAQSGHWISLLCITLGLLLTAAPAVFGIALAAYVAIALLLLGGITGLPWLIGVLLGWLTPRLSRQTVPLLALERARRQSDTAAVAVSGVVASLSLAVALTVMVASFRESVTHWLDLMLPADLYVRSAGNLAATDTVFFNPEFVAAASRLPGVKKLQSQRMLPLQLQSDQAAVSLLARELGDPTRTLPLLQPPVAVPEGMVGVFVSEAVVDLFGARPGQVFPLLSQTFMPLAQSGKAKSVIFFVAAVWRDYARQNGAIVMDRSTFEDLTGDRRSNELSLWLHDAQSAADVQRALLTLAGPQAARGADPVTGTGGLLEFGTTAQIRAISLRMFDRSFAVTYWLQAVAIGIGLFGIAASFSAQVLSRRKEFGLLAHLGLTRRQILGMVTLEGAAWTTLGAIAGLGLGLVVAVVLVHVVNPQSFHWTMDLMLPWPRLLLLGLAVVLAGTLTAWLAGRNAAGQHAVLAVREDW
jgi:putative ABC transport system permease protein